VGFKVCGKSYQNFTAKAQSSFFCLKIKVRKVKKLWFLEDKKTSLF